MAKETAEERVVALVRIRFKDGREEEIGVTLDKDRAPHGTYFRCWVYPPEGATVVGSTPSIRSTANGKKITVEQTQAALLPRD
jgi:hypothetical protein